MIFSNPINAVVLDMDGTLHDTEVAYHAAIKTAVEAVGFTVTEAFCHSLIGIPGPESDAMLRAHLGPAFPFAEYDRLYERYVASRLAREIPLKTGARELLQSLAEHDLRAAVATSAGRRAAERDLARSGLRRLLRVVVTRDDVAYGKPHPDLFLHAASLLGVPPHKCLAIEDSFNGIRAAHAAGMMPIMVPDLLTPTEEIRALCVCIAADLNEVRTLIANYADGEVKAARSKPVKSGGFP
ncbi:MAG: HAD family hydrolase [Acetobacteraceae bacterium]